jgi:hypothetical protein
MPIGLGIVGCGDLAQHCVLPNLAQPDALPLARVAALCGRTLGRAQTLAELYHVPRVTADYAELLADKAVEAVLILTPARLHFNQTLAAVRAGMHVYVHKPLTVTLAVAMTLERDIKRQGVCPRAVSEPARASPAGPHSERRHRDPLLGARARAGLGGKGHRLLLEPCLVLPGRCRSFPRSGCLCPGPAHRAPGSGAACQRDGGYCGPAPQLVGPPVYRDGAG